MTPGRRSAYPIGRSLIIGSRAIHETIWTVLFVTVLGFGMLAGVLALTMFCVGFAGKLFTDEIEAIDMGPVEALRSVGAGPLQVFQYGVLPQVRVAFAGIAIYTWDVAFRAATVVGFFGGGGMGWYLKRTVQNARHPARRRDPPHHHRARDGRRARLGLAAQPCPRLAVTRLPGTMDPMP